MENNENKQTENKEQKVENSETNGHTENNDANASQSQDAGNANVENSGQTKQEDERVIAGHDLEKIQTRTSVGQKVLIAISILILIAIGLSFEGAEKRENMAAQQNFTHPAERIIQQVAQQTGIAQQYGYPGWRFAAETKGADLILDYGANRLSQKQASALGLGVCAALAREYVEKGYMPRHMRVLVAHNGLPYGEAIFNGDINALGWEPARQTGF